MVVPDITNSQIGHQDKLKIEPNIIGTYCCRDYSRRSQYRPRVEYTGQCNIETDARKYHSANIGCRSILLF